MTKDRLILVGAGGHSRSCIDVIEAQGVYKIAGLIGFSEQVGTSQLGYEIIGTDSSLVELANKNAYALVTVGQILSSEDRVRLYQLCCKSGFRMPVVNSPFALVSKHAEIGHGTIILHGAIVNAGARIGENCIINTSALVEHDATINDHCHISTGAIINGDSNIGKGTFIGSHATVLQGVSIGEDCVVGAGLCVRKDLNDRTIFRGK